MFALNIVCRQPQPRGAGNRRRCASLPSIGGDSTTWQLCGEPRTALISHLALLPPSIIQPSNNRREGEKEREAERRREGGRRENRWVRFAERGRRRDEWTFSTSTVSPCPLTSRKITRKGPLFAHTRVDLMEPRLPVDKRGRLYGLENAVAASKAK